MSPAEPMITALMLIMRSQHPSMSLLGDHPSVRFSYYRGGIGVVDADMH